MMIVPVLLIAFAAFWAMYLAVRWRRRHTRRGKAFFRKHQLSGDTIWPLARRVRSHMIVTTMVLFFFVHMPLTQEITKLLTCQPYEDTPGVYYSHLVASPTVLCGAEPQTTWLSVALVFLFVYSFGTTRVAARAAAPFVAHPPLLIPRPRAGIPLVGFLILFANRHDLARREFVDTYGFLFSGFEPRAPHIYWEVSLVMVRKIGFIFLTVFLATTTVLTQAYTATIFVFACIAVHSWVKPCARARARVPALYACASCSPARSRPVHPPLRLCIPLPPPLPRFEIGTSTRRSTASRRSRSGRRT
jgi:hypothetical protein